MGSELVTLRMLLIAATSPQQELWREGAAMASIPIDFNAVDANGARVMFAKGGVDFCVLEAACPDDDKAALVRSARRIEDQSPLMFVSASRGSARPDNIDGVLPPPADSAEACQRIEICIRARMPTQVLIASDSDALRGILRKILEASRYELDVQEALDSVATLGKLRRSTLSMVFLDAGMPGLNGADTLLAIKRQNPDVKIALMADSMGKTTSEKRRLERVLVLKKPFYQADIDAVLKLYYGLHESN